MKGSNSRRALRTIELFGEVIKHTLEMPDGDVSIDIESFELMKHRRMGYIDLSSIAFRDIDHPNRKIPLLHFPHLPVTGVWGKDYFLIFFISVRFAWVVNKKRFPFVSGRVIFRHIERLKRVVIPVDFRMSDACKSDTRENVCYFLNRLRHDMELKAQ